MGLMIDTSSVARMGSPSHDNSRAYRHACHEALQERHTVATQTTAARQAAI